MDGDAISLGAGGCKGAGPAHAWKVRSGACSRGAAHGISSAAIEGSGMEEELIGRRRALGLLALGGAALAAAACSPGGDDEDDGDDDEGGRGGRDD